MSFETVSFSDLIHEGFQIEGTQLLRHLLLRNELRHYVERALLAELLEKQEADKPAVSRQAAQAWFDRYRSRLDYKDPESTTRMLEALGISIEDLDAQVRRQIAQEQRIDREIVRIQQDSSRRAAVFWHIFLDGSLRGRALRAAATELLGAQAASPAVDPDVQRVKSHCVLAHGASDWREVERRLVQDWGMTPEMMSALLDLYGRAVAAAK